MSMNHGRYRPFPRVNLKDRTWPDRVIEKAPILCSVCLRDGNQALIEPMGPASKLRMFELLVKTGLKEIEVGFPAASQTDYDFVRQLIERDLIPDDVTIQVLTQSREELIRRSFDAVEGARRVIVHLYNSTSELQRRVVFGLDVDGVIDLALTGTRQIQALASKYPRTEWAFQYSPESFTGTELEVAARVCNAVIEEWQPTPHRKMIINLPATVEMSTPNIYADMIEWMCRNIARRESVIVSLHTHNDRGTGVAATELGLLAGAERVEGTLLGNGERTGNADIVTIALNLMSQGIDPRVDFSDLNEIVRVVEDCTGIKVHTRHPYAGELAFTAFSGSHQDAIGKGLKRQKHSNDPLWEVPYLHIDPRDVGRTYLPLIRINSQSGKGGIAHLMEEVYGLRLPRGLQIDFASIVQRIADSAQKEIEPRELREYFDEAYVNLDQPVRFVRHVQHRHNGDTEVVATIQVRDKEIKIRGSAKGLVHAFVNGLNDRLDQRIAVTFFEQQGVTSGTDAVSVAYVTISVPGRPDVWGVGVDADVARAPLLAVVSAANRAGIFGS